MGILWMVLVFLSAFFASRANLAAENAMPRQQLIGVHRQIDSTPEVPPNGPGLVVLAFVVVAKAYLGGLHHCYTRAAA
jgi:hypothetical protein